MPLTSLDHLVYATPDVDATVADLERRLGVRAAPGGQNPDRGTRNCLVAIGPRAYLEIVGPDPTLPRPEGPRWFLIDTLTEPRLVTWAAKAESIEERAAEAARRGVPLGPVHSGSRLRPDGVRLAWTFTDPSTLVAGGVVPFLIDWGASPHPAAAAAAGPDLISLRAEHPQSDEVRVMLTALDIPLPVSRGPAPALVARFRGARGEVELR